MFSSSIETVFSFPELVSNATKTYSLGLAAEQVPAVDDFLVETLENLQIIEDDAQAAAQSPEEDAEFGAGRKAMSDWLLKYGGVAENTSSQSKKTTLTPFAMNTNLFSQLRQEATAQSKVQLESVS